MRVALDINEGWDSIAGRVVRGQLIDGAEAAWTALEKSALDSVCIVLTDIGETITFGEMPAVTTISLTWPDFFARACGRVGVDDVKWRERVHIDGDFDLGARFLSAITMTP